MDFGHILKVEKMKLIDELEVGRREEKTRMSAYLSPSSFPYAVRSLFKKIFIAHNSW